MEALDDRFKVQGTGKNTPEGWALRFEELDVWKRSARLSAEIYRGLMELRDFCFRDQITRAGLSVPSNIAEGYERDSDREFLKFLSYAKGSCGELRTQIYIGMDIGYIDRQTGRRWVEEATAVSGMLGALMKARKRFLSAGE